MSFQFKRHVLEIASDARTLEEKLNVTCGFFGLLFSLLRWAPPKQNEALLNITLGSLGTAWVAIVSYYFGSSAGSDRKNEIIAKISGND